MNRRYRILTRVPAFIEGRTYRHGDVATIEDATAAPLLEHGIIEPVGDQPKRAKKP